MILKELTIKNFRSYYGDDNRFVFNPNGLTLIIGDNGDGKTTFFEALEWLFDTTGRLEKDDVNNVSEMRKVQMSDGEVDEVRVTIKFDHDGEKELTKAFSFKKSGSNGLQIINREFIGYQFDGVERTKKNGNIILDSSYDVEIRHYSMFKGETELDIFHKDSEALKRLLKNFSDLTRLDAFVDLTKNLKETASKVHERELAKDKNTSKKVQSLESDRTKCESEIFNIKRQIRDQEDNSRVYKGKIDVMVDNREVKDNLDSINSRISAYEDKVRQLRNIVNVDYNTALLDKHWILCAFPPILNELTKKVTSLRKERDNIDKRHQREIGEQQLLAKLALPDGLNKLPWYVPNEEYLEEMIKDECCKVCGTPAKKGSKPYLYMVQKLQLALENKNNNKVSEEDIFKNKYIEELQGFRQRYSGLNEQNLIGITDRIKEYLEFVAKRTEDLEKYQQAYNDAKDEKSRLLAQLNGVSEEDITRTSTDFRNFINKYDEAQRKLEGLNKRLQDLEKEKDEIERRISLLNTENKEIARLGRISHTFSLIYKAFISTKEKNRKDFIDYLKSLSNQYLAKLSGNDFHGYLEMKQSKETETVDIMLKSRDENGPLVTNPSESQKTIMYMSVLFAIADVTAAKRETAYPLIFDAPTSSFSQMKESEFYNIINGIKKQCIIVTKDMLEYNAKTKTSSIKSAAYSLSCPIYRIEKDRTNFDEHDLSSIRIKTTKIK